MTGSESEGLVWLRVSSCVNVGQPLPYPHGDHEIPRAQAARRRGQCEWSILGGLLAGQALSDTPTQDPGIVSTQHEFQSMFPFFGGRCPKEGLEGLSVLPGEHAPWVDAYSDNLQNVFCVE